MCSDRTQLGPNIELSCPAAQSHPPTVPRHNLAVRHHPQGVNCSDLLCIAPPRDAVWLSLTPSAARLKRELPSRTDGFSSYLLSFLPRCVPNPVLFMQPMQLTVIWFSRSPPYLELWSTRSSRHA